VQDIVKEGAKVIENTFKGAGGATKDAVEKVKTQVESMIGSATDDRLLQAVIDLQANNFGSISGIRLFMFWTEGGGEINPIKYKPKAQLF